MLSIPAYLHRRNSEWRLWGRNQTALIEVRILCWVRNRSLIWWVEQCSWCFHGCVCVCICHVWCGELGEGLDRHCHGSIGGHERTRMGHIRNVGCQGLGLAAVLATKTIPWLYKSVGIFLPGSWKMGLVGNVLRCKKKAACSFRQNGSLQGSRKWSNCVWKRDELDRWRFGKGNHQESWLNFVYLFWSRFMIFCYIGLI